MFIVLRREFLSYSPNGTRRNDLKTDAFSKMIAYPECVLFVAGKLVRLLSMVPIESPLIWFIADDSALRKTGFDKKNYTKTI